MLVFLSRRFGSRTGKSESTITSFHRQCLLCAWNWPLTLVTSFRVGTPLTPISPKGIRRRELCPPMRTDVPANDVTDLLPAHQ